MSHMQSGTSFSALQKNLQLAYSTNVDDQMVAAENLAKLVETTTFPAVSFGPLAHALCRLLPSPSIDVASYAGKATKLMILEGALRPQVNSVGAPTVICSAVKQWEDEPRCLRELLGALQTLCYDKSCVRGVVASGVITNLIDYIQASDEEIAVLALSTLGNILSYCDTMFLEDEPVIDSLMPAMSLLLEIVHTSGERPQRFYAAAGIANAAAHPSLAEVLLDEGGLGICQHLESQASATLHIMGSQLGECAQTSLYLLSQGNEGDSESADRKYRFVWGTEPTMQLQLVSSDRHKKLLTVCAVVWFIMIFYTFSPVLFGSSSYNSDAISA
jgi:hypothetical protein